MSSTFNIQACLVLMLTDYPMIFVFISSSYGALKPVKLIDYGSGFMGGSSDSVDCFRTILMGRSGGGVLRFVMVLERPFGDYLRQSVTVHLGVGRLHPPHVSVKWTSVDYPLLAFEVSEDTAMHFEIHTGG